MTSEGASTSVANSVAVSLVFTSPSPAFGGDGVSSTELSTSRRTTEDEPSSLQAQSVAFTTTTTAADTALTQSESSTEQISFQQTTTRQSTASSKPTQPWTDQRLSTLVSTSTSLSINVPDATNDGTTTTTTTTTTFLETTTSETTTTLSEPKTTTNQETTTEMNRANTRGSTAEQTSASSDQSWSGPASVSPSTLSSSTSPTTDLRCCCRCCYPSTAPTCTFCAADSLTDAAECAKNKPRTVAKLDRSTPKFERPAALVGSKHPERLAYREDFLKSEQLTETLAALSESQKIDLGFKSSDLIVDCTYDGSPCSTERFVLSMLFFSFSMALQ